MGKELIDVVRVVRIGGPKAHSFYLLIPSTLREKIGVQENSEFLCYFDGEALIYVPKEKGASE